jgi:thioredoxin-dependent peroxiredoxin
MPALEIGKKAPNFSLFDEKNESHSLQDYVGQKVVIYFYPKDDTPGCTKEACGLRDNYNVFDELGVKVIGVSHDSIESHKKFKEKYELPFTLLSDPTKEMIKLYGAGGIMTRRVTYLIGEDGTVLKYYAKVDPTTHANEIIDDIKSL